MTVGDLLALWDWLVAEVIWAASSSTFTWVVAGALVLIVAACLWWSATCPPAFALVARTLHHEKPFFIRVALTFADVVGIVACLSPFAGRTKVTRLARLRVEWAVMGSDPDRASQRILDEFYKDDEPGSTPKGRHRLNVIRDDAERAKHGIAMFNWLKGWRDETVRPLPAGRYVVEPVRRYPLDFALDYVLDHRYQRAAWVAYQAETSGPPAQETIAAGIRTAREGATVRHRPIKVDNCFAINERRDAISCYFETLEFLQNVYYRSMPDNEPFGPMHRFIAPIEIGEGYVAPLHLIAGLSVEFADDWAPAIRDFGQRAVNVESRESLPRQHLERLRSTQFVIWLTWGPSIPVCSCSEWEAWNKVPVLQYGFGDEGNSLPLVIDAVDDPLVTHSCATGGVAIDLSAQRVVLERGAYLPQASVGGALESIRAPDSIVLHAEGATSGDPHRRSPRPYYSAYVWVMFEIVAPGGGSSPAFGQPHIGRMLPFFEHGNIADADLYAHAREQLVAKTLGALASLLATTPEVSFRYACAIDDSNCGHGLPRATLDERRTIRGLMRAELRKEGKRYPGLSAGALGLDLEGSNYCSCVLPGLLKSYFEDVKKTSPEPSIPSPIFDELTATPADLAKLDAFYHGVYTSQFPDPDERESLENMRMYLEHKAAGRYGRNNYHLVVAEVDGEAVGGFVLDYLEQPNAGVIEFLFLAPSMRGKGFGHRLIAEVDKLLSDDASRTGRQLDLIVAEMNDPFVASNVPDNMNPFERAIMWGNWGYSVLDFPYVQPALSSDQGVVDNLALIARPLRADWHDDVPADVVATTVAEYLRLAMRIEEPASSPEYVAMKANLDGHASVRLIPLGRYVGEDAARPMHVTPVLAADRPPFRAAMEVYRSAFGASPAAVPEHYFAAALAGATATPRRNRYHLWVVAADEAAPAAGLVSFFSFARLGFGGYVALIQGLARTGRAYPLLARIERELIDETPACAGWLAECEATTNISVFTAFGFRVLDVPYQPPGIGDASTEGAALRLLYKPLGRVYGKRLLPKALFLETVASIFATVYGVSSPQQHRSYLRLVDVLGARDNI